MPYITGSESKKYPGISEMDAFLRSSDVKATRTILYTKIVNEKEKLSRKVKLLNKQ